MRQDIPDQSPTKRAGSNGRIALEPAFIARSCRPLHMSFDMLRLLLSLLLALALSFSPVAMASALGMPHGTAGTAAAGESHCGASNMPADDQEAGGEMGCAGTCAAFPAIQPSLSEMPPRLAAQVVKRRHQVLTGVQPERVTPPPRVTPEV